jgi:hypothetical protein
MSARGWVKKAWRALRPIGSAKYSAGHPIATIASLGSTLDLYYQSDIILIENIQDVGVDSR